MSTPGLDEALRLKRAGDLDGALIALEGVLGGSPSHPLALANLADVQLKRGRSDEAGLALDRAEAAAGTTSQTARLRGDLHYHAGRWSEAARSYSDANASATGARGPSCSWAGAVSAWATWTAPGGRHRRLPRSTRRPPRRGWSSATSPAARTTWTNAEAMYDRAHEHAPGDEWAYAKLVEVRLLRLPAERRDPEIQVLLKTTGGDNKHLLGVLARLRSQEGDEDAAARTWEERARQTGDVYARKMQGFALRRAGWLDEAAAVLGPCLVEQPDDLILFRTYLGLQRRRGALEELRATLEDALPRAGSRRIRDRYRPNLTLSMRHVEDLVRGRLVQLRPGAEPFVERAWAEITAAFPDARLSRERFERCYPLHPDTLAVLEGLRFVLSQQRGVVDFICSRLRQCLDRGYAGLVTPEDVFDHFRGRLHERAETARLADTVVAYFERSAEEVVDAGDRELALRTVKLLCVLAASPLERPRTAAELAYLLLARMSDLDPAANPRYLENAVLAPLVERGAYVVADEGPPRTYTVEVGADAAIVARARVAQVRADTAPGDRRLVATLVELGSSPTVPLQLLGEVGLARREFLWHNTLRSLLVGTVRVLEFVEADAAGELAERLVAGTDGKGQSVFFSTFCRCGSPGGTTRSLPPTSATQAQRFAGLARYKRRIPLSGEEEANSCWHVPGTGGTRARAMRCCSRWAVADTHARAQSPT